MKLEMKVTKRDKFLLVFIVIALVLSAGYFFFLEPELNKISDLETQQEDLSFQQQEYQMKILQTAGFEQQISELNQKLSDLSNSFFGRTTTEQVESFFTSMLLKHQMSEISQLTLKDAEITQIPAYKLSQKGFMETSSATTLNDSTTGETTSNATNSSYTYYVYTNTVSFSAKGSQENVEALLDELNATEGVNITSFNMVDENTTDGENIMTQKNITVNVCYYQIDK